MPNYQLHNPYPATGNGGEMDKRVVKTILEDYGLANVRQVLTTLPFDKSYYRDNADSTVTVGEIYLPNYEYVDVNLHTLKLATDGSHLLVETVSTTTCDSCERETDREALDVTDNGNALCPSCSIMFADTTE